MRKNRGQLVSQHLERLSRDVLEQYQSIIKNYVRNRQGIYALYKKEKLYYVGLASNLRNRLKHHLRDRHGTSWNRFSIFLTVGDSHLREMESLILRITQPKGNKVKGKFSNSENLRIRFKKDIRDFHRSIEYGLFSTSFKEKKINSKKSKNSGPILAIFSGEVKRLRAFYKGRKLNATVLRTGKIRFKNKVFNSPSLAGAAACKRRTCNGWTFWQYERAPGDWINLDHLRR